MTRSVLLIEDEAYVREALTRMVGSMGARVRAESDGDAGLVAFREQRFDAVLLDLNLPGMPGSAVLQALRRQSPQQVVVVLTGHASSDEGIESASAVLIKPVTRHALAEAITRALGGPRGVIEQPASSDGSA